MNIPRVSVLDMQKNYPPQIFFVTLVKLFSISCLFFLCFFFEDLFSKGGKDDFPDYDTGLFDLEDGTASPLSAFLDILRFSSHSQLAQE